MTDWWIDSSKPGPTRDYMAELSIQSAARVQTYTVDSDWRRVTIFEEVRGENAALWLEGDPIFSNGAYYGRIVEIETHKTFTVLPLLSGGAPLSAADICYTIKLSMPKEEVEKLWTQNPSPQQLSKLLERA